MRKLIILLCTIAVSLSFFVNKASATRIYFDPVDHIFDIGDTLFYDLYADIDTADAIMGFGFDLSFDEGATFITSPGDSGPYLTFTSFTGNPALFTYVYTFDDGDTISGWRTLFEPDMSGIGILLGRFECSVIALGTETITLGADSLGITGSEGLVRGFTATNPGGAFMPNTPTATASPVPEPASCVLLLFGFAGMLGVKKKYI